MPEWMFAFLDALIIGDISEARRIAYENEGEQMDLFNMMPE